MVDCGIAWQVTGQEKYARRVADMLLKAYADLYPTLGFHPVTLSKTRAASSGRRSTKASGWSTPRWPTTASTTT